jgi:hypothetical protein
MPFFTQSEIDNLPAPPHFLIDPILKEQSELFNKVLSLGVVEIKPIQKALDKVFQHPLAKIIEDAWEAKILRFTGAYNMNNPTNTNFRPSKLFVDSPHYDLKDEDWEALSIDRCCRRIGLSSFMFYKKMFKPKSGNNKTALNRLLDFNYLYTIYNNRRENNIKCSFHNIGELIDYFKKTKYSFKKVISSI